MINECDFKDFSNKGRLFYCIDFKSKNNELHITTNDKEIKINDILYNNCCQIENIQYGELNFQDKVCITLIKIDNYKYDIEELLISKIVVKIIFQFEDNNSISYKEKIVFKGFVSNIIENNNVVKIQISSNISMLNSRIGQLFSPICRECFGSEKCGVNLQSYKSKGRVVKVISQDYILGDHQENKKTSIGYYRFGTIRFLNGKLKGISLQIKDEEDGKIYLLKNTNMIYVGDEYEIFTGCNKTIKDCNERFNNIKNFRGEPYINA